MYQWVQPLKCWQKDKLFLVLIESKYFSGVALDGIWDKKRSDINVNTNS